MLPGPCFRDAACAKLGCTAETYAQTVFWHCLATRARRIARLVLWFRPGLPQHDLDLLDVAARCATPIQVYRELDAHRANYPQKGFLRQKLGVRLSGAKLMELAKELLPG